MAILLHWDEVGEQITSTAVSKSSIDGVGASLTRVSIKAGTQAGRHAHPFEQFVQVISGSGMLETRNGVQRFAAGSVFHFLPDTWHAAVFEEDTVLVETNLTTV